MESLMGYGATSQTSLREYEAQLDRTTSTILAVGHACKSAAPRGRASQAAAPVCFLQRGMAGATRHHLSLATALPNLMETGFQCQSRKLHVIHHRPTALSRKCRCFEK